MATLNKNTLKIRKAKELAKLAALDNYQVIGEYTFSAVKVEFLCDKQHSFHMPLFRFTLPRLC